MSQTTGQAPPRPQVEFSTSSPPSSTIHEHRGERRRVLKHGPGGVTFDRPDAPHEPAQTVSRGAWLEWTRPAAALDFDGAPIKGKRLAHRDLKPANMPESAPVAHRDLKPENITARDAAHRDPKPPKAPSEKAKTALATLRRCGSPEGLVDKPRRALLEASGLHRLAWPRAVDELREAGWVTTWTVNVGRVDETRYQITPGGMLKADRLKADRLMGESPPAHEPVASRSRAGREPLLSSPSASVNAEGEREPTKDSGSPPAHEPVGEPVATAAMPSDLAAAWDTIQRQARIIETLVARLDALDRCACGAPTKPKKNGKGEWFPSCVRWPECPAQKKNSEGRSRPDPKRVEAERAEIKAAEERPVDQVLLERQGKLFSGARR